MKNILFLSFLVLPDERPQSILLSGIIKELNKDKKYNIFLLTHSKINKLTKKKNFFRYSLDNKAELLFKKFAFYKYIKILFPNIFYKDLIKRIEQITKKQKIDIVIPFSNPYYLNSVANNFYLKKKQPFISYYSDPFLYSSYNHINFILKPFLKKLENSILKNSNKIIFTNNSLKKYVFSKHKENFLKKGEVIPHFFEKEIFINKEKSIKKSKKIIFSYFGSFYGPRKPDPLINAVLELNKEVPGFEREYFFEFYGSNQLGFFDENALKKIKIPKNIIFKKRVNQNRSRKLMNKKDILISIDGKNIENIYLPSKIIEYLQHKKPILAISNFNSPSHQLSKVIDITFADIDDIYDIKKKIIKIIKKRKLNKGKEINFYNLKNIIKLWKKVIN